MRDKCPFPQANNVDFMIQVFLNIGTDGITKFDVENSSGLKDRQGSYYLDALVYLDLIEKYKTKYYLTERGKEIKLSPLNQLNETFCDVILGNNLLNYLYDKTRGFETQKEAKEFISTVLATTFELGSTTADRRTSTVNAWFNWIDKVRGVKDNE